LQDAGVPILIQAYPDEIDRMDFSNRRDAFCGKFSVMDVFTQYQLPFSSFKPHVVHPRSPKFTEHINIFDAVCRVVNGMKRMTVGSIGARTTAFKTVRYDELTLQKYGITNEVIDLSEIIHRVQNFDVSKEDMNKILFPIMLEDSELYSKIVRNFGYMCDICNNTGIFKKKKCYKCQGRCIN